MTLPAQFLPKRRTGLIFHAIITAVLAVTGGFSLFYALQSPSGSTIIGWYLAAIMLLLPVAFFVYRAYSLLQARYLLDRDGLRIRWGLRGEDIALPDVEWIRPANELGYSLRLPFVRFPGSVFGKRNTEGLGQVEFLASDDRNLLLIATPMKVYAISPEDSRQFINAFLRAMELGSLSPLVTATTLPTAFLKRVWADRAARLLIFLGIFFTVLLVVSTSGLVSSRAELPLGFDTDGNPFPPGPSEYLILLPVLGSMVFGFNLLAGMFFYRNTATQPVSYLLWGAGILIPVLLLTAVILMAQ